MQVGLGVLEWKPEEFWKSTWPEYVRAVEGWQEKNGVKPMEESFMSRTEFEDMMKRFPDG